MSSTSLVPAGRVIDGRYRLHSVLGRGGMSTVYAAEHIYTRRPVAVKVLLPEMAVKPDMARRFLDEARAAARIRHRHCVDILDMGQSDGALYLVQELLQGMDLARYRRLVGRVPWPEALAIVLPVIDALGAAHAEGILHRDVKPANIFLAEEPDGTVVPKLIDFGIAKLLEADEDGHEETRAGTLTGTVTYMAPEQVRGERPLDGRVDVWSVGVVLYEMLVGAGPFAGDSLAEVMAQVLYHTAPRVDASVLDVPRRLCEGIAQALERDRERRFASMAELGWALRECLVGEAEALPPVRLVSVAWSNEEATEAHPAARSAARTAGTVGTVAATPVIPVTTAWTVAAVPSQSPRPPRSVGRRWGLSLAVAMLVLALAGLGWWRWQGRSRMARAPTPAPPAPQEVRSMPAVPREEALAAPVRTPVAAPVVVLPPTPSPVPATPSRPRRRPQVVPGANGAPIVD